jgi:hypothetical protein
VFRRPVLFVLAMVAILTMFPAMTLFVILLFFSHGFLSSVPLY